MNNLRVMKKTLIVDRANFAEEYSLKISRKPQGISISLKKAILFHSRSFYSPMFH